MAKTESVKMRLGLLGTYRHKDSGLTFYCDQTINKHGRLICYLTDRRGTEYKRYDSDSSEFEELI